MDNRFGIKDLVLFLLIGILFVAVILAMEGYDRQWDEIHKTNTLLTQQTTDLAAIRRLIEQGGIIGRATTGQSDSSAMAGFERVLKSHSAPDYAQGDDLVDLFLATPSKLTPLISVDLPSDIVQSFVLDSLCNRDPNTLDWLPNLAIAWPPTNDPLVFDFELRRGVTFSDGSPFTADDVVFTFNMIEDQRIETPRMRVAVDKLSKVEKLDDYHVRFTFKEPYFQSFETAAGMPILCKAFYSKFNPTDFNNSTGLLLGSGPYRLPDPASWRPTPGEPIILVRNERYWGPAPSFNRIVWKVIENNSARVTAFRNGDVDIFAGLWGPTPDQFDQMVADPELSKRANHWKLDVPSEGFFYIGWNEKQGRDGKPTIFADPRVRRAMTMLTDRTAIIRDILRGYASPITGPFSPLTPQADPSIQPWPYDPDAAQKLLTEAGFVRQGDRLIGPDGNPVQFKILYNGGDGNRKRIASFVHDSYAKAGIEADPEPAEWSVLLKRLDERQFDVYLGGWTGSIEFDAYGIYHSSQMAGTGDDFIQYKNEALDKLIEQARATVDVSKRMPLWHEVNRLMHEDEPCTFLYINQDLSFIDNRFRGIDVTKLGLNSSAEWYTPASLQKYHE